MFDENLDNDAVELDTQPNRSVPPIAYDRGGLKAPPKILFYGVIGFFMLGIIGMLAGVVIFRDVLDEAQRVRFEGYLPFMNAFNPDRIDNPNATAPASLRQVSQEEIDSLYNLELQPNVTLGGEIMPEVTDEPLPTPSTPTPTPVAAIPTETATVPPAVIDPTATPLPTALPSPMPQDTSGFSDTTVQARTWPTSHVNTGFTWYKQTWNNCGPTNVTMALSYYGWTQNQTYAGERLKPDREDKNVSPSELAGFVEQYTDLDAMVRYGGDLDMLRRLIAAGFPVIVERSHMFEGYEWLGHYQTIVGYDDLSRNFFIYDSFLGEDAGASGINETYEEVDTGWEGFNRVFVVIYTPSRESEVKALIGQERITLEASGQHAFEVAQSAAQADPDNGFLWYNMGTSLTTVGLYEEASRAYDRALSLGLPWRIYWYQFGPFEAYFEVGRYDDVLLLVANNLGNGGEDVEETYYWQGRVLAAQGNVSGARQAFQRALSRNRNFALAQEALDNL